MLHLNDLQGSHAGMESLRNTLVATLGSRCTAAEIAQLTQQLAALLEAQKLEALAEFSAGAGHEINNPVATIAGRAAQLLAAESDPERRRALSIIGGQALRIRDMMGDVMLFARPPVPAKTRVSLAEVFSDVVRGLDDLREARKCTIAMSLSPVYEFWGDRCQIAIVLSAVLRNALEACDDAGGQIEVRGVATTRERVAGCLVTVSDNGRGFSAEECEHLFDPFYSGRQAGRGLGFGLSKAWRILQQHGGQIEIHRGSGKTHVEVWLPSEYIA